LLYATILINLLTHQAWAFIQSDMPAKSGPFPCSHEQLQGTTMLSKLGVGSIISMQFSVTSKCRLAFEWSNRHKMSIYRKTVDNSEAT